CSRSWAGRRLTWDAFHQIKERTPLLKPKLRLPYRELQALAVLRTNCRRASVREIRTPRSVGTRATASGDPVGRGEIPWAHSATPSILPCPGDFRSTPERRHVNERWISSV